METKRAGIAPRRWLAMLVLAVALTNSGCAAVAAGVVGGIAGGATYTMLNGRADATTESEPRVVPVKATPAEPPLDY